MPFAVQVAVALMVAPLAVRELVPLAVRVALAAREVPLAARAVVLLVVQVALAVQAVALHPATQVKTIESGSNVVKKASYDTVSVRPMGVSLSESTFVVLLELEDDESVYGIDTHFDYELVESPLPAAKWGITLDGASPEANATVPNQLTGLYHVKPKKTVLAPLSGNDPALDLDIATAFTYDVVDDSQAYPDFTPNHLPLSPTAEADNTPPMAAANYKAAMTDITAALSSSNVIDLREDIFSALAGFGINPNTNDPLSTFGKTPSNYLNGAPMLAETS